VANSSLISRNGNDEMKRVLTLKPESEEPCSLHKDRPGANVIKLFTAVSYDF
jgi:hypothetical protein